MSSRKKWRSALFFAALCCAVGSVSASDGSALDLDAVKVEESLIREAPLQSSAGETFSLPTPQRSREVIRMIEHDPSGNYYWGNGYGDQQEAASQNSSDAILKSIEWGVVLEGELVGNVNSNTLYERQADAVFNANFGFLMHTGKKGTFYGLMEAGYGWGIDGHIATLHWFNDEIDTNHDLHFGQAWYEQAFGVDDCWRFRIGQIDASTSFDNNMYANSGISQFNASGLVINLVNEIPYKTFGGMLWRDFGKAMSVGAAYMSSYEWDDIFSDGAGILETDFHFTVNDRPMNFRVFGSVSRVYKRIYYDHVHYGWGISFDQELSHYLGIWSRVGQGSEKYNWAASHYSGGLHFQHFNPCHDEDVIGIGYSVAEAGGAITDDESDWGREHFLEAYYRRQLNDFSHLSPFVQYVKNPLGDEDAGSVLVLGLRAIFEI